MMLWSPREPHPWLKPAVLVGGVVPLAAVGARALKGTLAADAIAQVLNQLGLLALVFLVASLACTPLKQVTGWAWPIRIRRRLGLFSFFYAVLHFSVYVVLDQAFDWRTILEDITKRKFIAVGFAALMLLVPLAVTSTNGMVRRLGFPKWKRLHRLAYVATVLAVLHFIWRVKQDLTEPAIYAFIVTVLLLMRLAPVLRQKIRSV